MIAMVQSTNVSHLDKLRNQKTKNGAWYQTLVRWDIAIASCPAPLIRRGISTWFEPDILLTAEWAANFSCELSPGSHFTDSALCWKLAPFRPRHSQHKNTFFFFFWSTRGSKIEMGMELSDLVLNGALNRALITRFICQVWQRRDNSLTCHVNHCTYIHSECHLQSYG